MAHTSDQRDEHALCGAKLKAKAVNGTKADTGKTCRHWAGERTPHPGYGPCWLHHGNVSGHVVSGVRQEAEREMVKAGAIAIDLSPAELMINCLQIAAGRVATGQRKLADDDLTPVEQAALFRQVGQELDRAVRFTQAADGMGVKPVKTFQADIELIMSAVGNALIELGLREPYKSKLGPAMRRHLLMLQGVPPEDLTGDKWARWIRTGVGQSEGAGEVNNCPCGSSERSMFEGTCHHTECFNRRIAEAEELGLWTEATNSEQAKARTAKLAALGFEEWDSDKWERNFAAVEHLIDP